MRGSIGIACRPRGLPHMIRVDLDKDSKVHYYESMRCEPPAPRGLTEPAGLASCDGRLRSLRTGETTLEA